MAVIFDTMNGETFRVPWIPVTTAWLVLRLQMKETSFRYGG